MSDRGEGAASSVIQSSSMFRRFRWPKRRLAHFVARRSLKAVVGWALAFGLFTVVNIAGYDATYGTPEAAAQLARSLGSNVGIQMLLGEPFRIDMATGFADWRVLGTVSLVGSIWGLLYATKTFRGEEAAGRLELFLAGQTTARRAAANIFLGLGVNLALMFAVITALVAGLGQATGEELSLGGSMSYSLVITSIVALFMAVGAVASQVMSTRSRAATVSAVVFGVFFLMRGVAVSSSVPWLLDCTPFGWLGKIHPLTENNMVWFLPVFGLIATLVLATLYFAGKRDMGSSLAADKDTAKARTGLLDSPMAIAFRLTRATIFGWLAGIALVGLLLGTLANSASDTIAASSAAEQVVSRLSSGAELTGARSFLGMALFMVMLLVMLFVAGSLGAIRAEEAEGRLDNLLVRPLRRTKWLWGRIALAAAAVVAAMLLAGIAAWSGVALLQSGVPYGDLFIASINAMSPALFVLGFGVLVFGFVPRLTAPLTYGVVAWSFILQMVGSIMNLSHWILDLSVLHHVALAPAVDPNWTSAGILAGLGLLGCILGTIRFNRRDLQNE